MIIQQKIQELEQLKRDAPKQAKLIASKFKEQILDYIREEQLFKKGIDGNGDLLQGYSEYTIALKRQKGEVYNRTTLLDTGSFYDKMDLIYTDQNAIGIFSRDEKSQYLVEDYGYDIFKFTVENQKEINKDIFEENLIKWILSTKTFTQI